MKLMRIGIFGGSFNPPHKMHLRMAKELLNDDLLDKIIYVPTGSKYIYKNNLVSDQDRYNMLKIMIKNDERLEVSDFELQTRNIYTYETLEYFKGIYLDDEIYFILGTDNLAYVDKWKYGIELLENNNFIVIRRSTDDIEKILKKYIKYRKNIVVSEVSESNISSTLIRDKIKNKENVLDFIDEDVYNYILENKLYGVGGE